MNPSSFQYYLKSGITLLKGIHNPFSLLALLIRKPSDQPKRIVLNNGQSFFVFNFLDVWILKETILDRQYETVGVPLQKDWTVIDIGAALGDYAVWAGNQITNGNVIAVEPYPPSVSLLYKNLQINEVSNVKVFKGAVSNSSGQTVLNVSAGGIVQNSTEKIQNDVQTVKVEAVSLVHLLEQFAVSKCDYLKLDCEGGEYDILFFTPKETLAKIDRICMEIHDEVTEYNRDEMIEFLHQNGYSTRLTPNPVHEYIAYLYAEKTTLKKENQ